MITYLNSKVPSTSWFGREDGSLANYLIKEGPFLETRTRLASVKPFTHRLGHTVEVHVSDNCKTVVTVLVEIRA